MTTRADNAATTESRPCPCGAIGPCANPRCHVRTGTVPGGGALEGASSLIMDGREVPVVIDPMLPDHLGVVEWNSDFTNNWTTPKRIVLRSWNERVLLHEVLHCLLGDNEALVRRATLLHDLGWRLSRV